MKFSLRRVSAFAALFLFLLGGCDSCNPPTDSPPGFDMGTDMCPGEPICVVGSYGCDGKGNVLECVTSEVGCPAWSSEAVEICANDQWCYMGGCFSVDETPLPPKSSDAFESLLDWGNVSRPIEQDLVVVPYSAFLNSLRLGADFQPAEGGLVEDAAELVMEANDPITLGVQTSLRPAETFEGDTFLVLMDPVASPGSSGEVGDGSLIESKRYFIAVMPGLSGRTSWVGETTIFIGSSEQSLPSGSCCRGPQNERSCGFPEPFTGGLTPPPSCSESPETCPSIPPVLSEYFDEDPARQPFRMGHGATIVSPDPNQQTGSLLLRGNLLPAVSLYVSQGRPFHEQLARELGEGGENQSELGLMFAPMTCDRCEIADCSPEMYGGVEFNEPNGLRNPCSSPNTMVEISSVDTSQCNVMTPKDPLNPSCNGLCGGFRCGGSCDDTQGVCDPGYVPGGSCTSFMGSSTAQIGSWQLPTTSSCNAPGVPGWCKYADSIDDACTCTGDCATQKAAFWNDFLGCGGLGGLPAMGDDTQCCGSDGDLCACQLDGEGNGFCWQCNDDGACNQQIVTVDPSSRYALAVDKFSSESGESSQRDMGMPMPPKTEEEGAPATVPPEQNEEPGDEIADIEPVAPEPGPVSGASINTDTPLTSNLSTEEYEPALEPVWMEATKNPEFNNPPEDPGIQDNKRNGREQPERTGQANNSAKGHADPKRKDADPVSLASGSLDVMHRDLNFAGPVRPLTFERYYDSQDNIRSVLGSNWTHNYDTRVIPIKAGNAPAWAPRYCTDHLPLTTCAFVDYPSIGKRLFIKNPADPNNLFYPSAGVSDTLELRDGEWTLHGTDGHLRAFNEFGYMTLDRDRFGNGFEVEYEPTPLYHVLLRYCHVTRSQEFYLRNIAMSGNQMQVHLAQDFDERSCTMLAAIFGDEPEPVMPSSGWIKRPEFAQRTARDLRLPSVDGAWRRETPTSLGTPIQYDARLHEYAEWLLNLDFAPNAPSGSRKLRPTRVRDDLGRTLEFSYHDAPTDRVQFGLLEKIDALGGLATLSFDYARPGDYPERLQESFLVRVERTENGNLPSGLVSSLPRFLEFDYNWPVNGFESYLDHRDEVEKRHLDYYGTWRGCAWDGQVCSNPALGGGERSGTATPTTLCGANGPSDGVVTGASGGGTDKLICRSSVTPQALGNPCFESRQAAEEYVSNVADNIVRIRRNGRIEVESLYEVDPDTSNFDRVLVQRYGGLDNSEYGKYAQSNRTPGAWESDYPEFKLEYVTTRPVNGMGEDATQSAMLHPALLSRYPLEEIPANANLEDHPCFENDSCGGVTSSTARYSPTCGANDRLINAAEASCDPNKHVTTAYNLPGVFATLPYFAIQMPMPDPAHAPLVRSRLTCRQIAARHLGNASHNGLMQQPIADGASVYWARLQGERALIQDDSRRICAWAKLTDRDGDINYVGMNFRGQAIVDAVLVEGRLLVDERLVNADGRVIEERFTTPGARSWEPDDGWAKMTYEELDPRGNGGWNDWIPFWWMRRFNLVSIRSYPDRRDGKTTWAHEWEPRSDVLTGEEIEWQEVEMTYEPIFNQLSSLAAKSSTTQSGERYHTLLVHEFDYQEFDPLSESFYDALFAEQFWGWRVPADFRQGKGQPHQAWLQVHHVPAAFYNDDINGDGIIGFPNHTNNPGLSLRGFPVRTTLHNLDTPASSPDWMKARTRLVMPAPHGRPQRIIGANGSDTVFEYYSIASNQFGDDSLLETTDSNGQHRGLLARVSRRRFDHAPGSDEGPFDMPLPRQVCAQLEGPYQWMLPQGCGNNLDTTFTSLGIPADVRQAFEDVADEEDEQMQWATALMNYSVIGRPRQVMRDGITSEVWRDLDGRMRRMQDPEGNELELELDLDSRVIASTFKEAGSNEILQRARYQHDVEGRLLTRCVDVVAGGCLGLGNFVAPLDFDAIRDDVAPEYLLSTYRYTPEGLIWKEMDARGLEVEHAYDARGLRTSTAAIHPSDSSRNRMTRYEYDVRGWPSRILHGTDRTRMNLGAKDESFEYDGFGRLRTYTDTDGAIWQRAWTLDGDPAAYKLGEVPYGAHGAAEPPAYWEVFLAYDGFKRLIERKEHDLVRSTIDYGPRGFPRRTESRPEGAVARSGFEAWYGHDLLGNRIWSLDSEGNQSVRLVDRWRRRVHGLRFDVDSASSSDVNVISSTSEHDLLWHVTGRQVTGSKGEVKLHEYDVTPMGYMRSYRAPDGQFSSVKHNLLGWTEELSVTSDLGASMSSVSTFTYNAYGQLIEEVEPGRMGGITRYGYSPFGEFISLQKPLAPNQPFDEYEHDGYGRIAAQNQYAAGVLSDRLTWSYVPQADGEERVDVTWVDAPTAEKLSRTIRYDALGRITETLENNLAMTHGMGWSEPRRVGMSYSHDALGRVRRVTQRVFDGANQVSEFSVDSDYESVAGGTWRRQLTYPSGSQWNRDMDTLGRLERISRTRVDGVPEQDTSVGLRWHGQFYAGRDQHYNQTLPAASRPDPMQERREFDGLMRRTEIRYQAVDLEPDLSPSRATWGDTYCAGAWRAGCEQPLFEVGLKYDVVDRIASSRRRYGHPVESMGAIIQPEARGSQWQGFGYSARGFLVGEWESGEVSEAAFDALPNHDITRADVEGVGWPNGAGVKWEYQREEGVGDLLSIKRADDQSVRWAHENPSNQDLRRAGRQLAQVALDGEGARALIHDGRGRLTVGLEHTHAFDPFDRLIQATHVSDVTERESYAYDALGRLVEVHRPSQPVETLVHDGAHVIASYKGTNLQWEATWGSNLDHLLAFRDVADPGGEQRYIPLRDERNNIVGLWNTESAEHVSLLSYSPQGRLELLDSNENTICKEEGSGEVCEPLGGRFPFAFNTAWRSPTTGLYSMRHRWYSPRLGQFISHDPLGSIDSYNLYAFAAFDPVNGWDPWGLQTCSITGSCIGDGVVEGIRKREQAVTDFLNTGVDVADGAYHTATSGDAANIAKDTIVGSAEGAGRVVVTGAGCLWSPIECLSDDPNFQKIAYAAASGDGDELKKAVGRAAVDLAEAALTKGAGKVAKAAKAAKERKGRSATGRDKEVMDRCSGNCDNRADDFERHSERNTEAVTIVNKDGSKLDLNEHVKRGDGDEFNHHTANRDKDDGTIHDAHQGRSYPNQPDWEDDIVKDPSKTDVKTREIEPMDVGGDGALEKINEGLEEGGFDKLPKQGKSIDEAMDEWDGEL